LADGWSLKAGYAPIGKIWHGLERIRDGSERYGLKEAVNRCGVGGGNFEELSKAAVEAVLGKQPQSAQR
jgi:hypothetical protein